MGPQFHHPGLRTRVMILKNPNADARVTIVMLTACHSDMPWTNAAYMATNMMSPASMPQ